MVRKDQIQTGSGGLAGGGLACPSETTTPFSLSMGFRGINGAPLPRMKPRSRRPPFIPRSH